MASITTVISFFILLLATLSYSAPIEIQPESTTSFLKSPIERPIAEHGSNVHTRMVDDHQTTDVPIHHEDRSTEEKNSDEVTTEVPAHSPRALEDDSSSPAPIDTNERSDDDESSTSSATETNERREIEDFSSTTWETSTQFNQRAIRLGKSEEDVETSTWLNQMEVTTDVEPMSSGHSFGKSTGLLNDEPSSTSENQPIDRSGEKQTPVKGQRLTQTISIIPGKITETKIYANSPSKTSVVVRPIEEDQLSEVQTQSNIETTKSDN